MAALERHRLTLALWLHQPTMEPHLGPSTGILVWDSLSSTLWLRDRTAGWRTTQPRSALIINVRAHSLMTIAGNCFFSVDQLSILSQFIFIVMASMVLFCNYRHSEMLLFPMLVCCYVVITAENISGCLGVLSQVFQIERKHSYRSKAILFFLFSPLFCSFPPLAQFLSLATIKVLYI